MRPWIDTFNEKHLPEPVSGCWLWIGASHRGGYGHMCRRVNGKIITVGAHRFSWQHHNGTIPDGLCVLHKCDVPACVNPDHLFLGTYKDNAVDCVQKGRSRRGEKNRGCKLTEAAVLEIRQLDKSLSLSTAELSEKFGVTMGAIRKIVTRFTWSYLDEGNT